MAAHDNLAHHVDDYEVDAEPVPSSECRPVKMKVEKLDSALDCDSKKSSDQDVIAERKKAYLSRNMSIDEYSIESDGPVGGLCQLKVESSAVEVANSSDVHIGHKLNQKTVINFERATSVVVDRRQITIVKTPIQEKSAPNFSLDTGKAENETSDYPAIISIVRDFNRNRYSGQLAYLTPLPWWTWFSPHLDNVFTGVQMVVSDRLDGLCDRSTIHLEQIFDTRQDEASHATPSLPFRILIEGNPGYGKTTLTLKMASDWASKKQYISMFDLVLRVPLRDFQGDLQTYIFRELFPQHEAQGREEWWHYLKNNHQNVLFLLDGLDELQPQHRDPIDMLLRSNIFDKVSIVATTRKVPSDDPTLCFFKRRIELRGFNPNQTEQFIQNYFQFKQKPKEASRLISLINGHRWCGRHLTACPLTCLFLCVVFEDEQDEGTLHKTTQIYQGLTSWLARRAPNKKQKQEGSDLSSQNQITPDYEQALSSFGELCLKALSQGETQFTSEELLKLPDNSADLILDLGLLIRGTGTGNRMILPKNIIYQPIHKTFLEYFAALYLSSDLDERFEANLHYLESQKMTRESITLILKFLAGLLGENASHLFRLRCLSSFQLPAITLFELLHESGATPENVRALSSILDDEIVTVHSDPIELDGWAGLLAAPDCPIRSLKFIWANAPFSNTSLDRFFAAFQSNHSVTCLVVTAANGFFPNDNDALAMGAFTVLALKKTCLRHFSLHLVGDTWSAKVVGAINNMLNHHQASRLLTSLKLNVDMGTEQVDALCQGLRHTNVKSLVLPKLSCDRHGFTSLSTLLKSLDHLSVSLNLMKAMPPSSVESGFEEGSPQDLQSLSAYFDACAKQRAGITLEERDEKSSVSSDQSDSDSCIGSAISLLVFLEENISGSFRLGDVARLPVTLAIDTDKIFHVNELTCQPDEHSSGFHALFTALRDPDCRIKKLDLTGCCLGHLDVACLAESLRSCSSVQYLRVADLKHFSDVIPLLTRTNICWLDVSSTFISIKDEDIIRLLRAVSTVESLKSLSLAGWKFTIKHVKLLNVVDKFLETSPVTELNLARCRFRIETVISTLLFSSAPSCVTLNETPPDKKTDYRAVFRSRKKSSQGSVEEPESMSLASSFDLDEQSHSSVSVEKRVWPSLNKLSLNETTVSIQVHGEEGYRTLSGPELFIYLEQCRNLTELSLSLKPVMPEFSSSTVGQLDDASTKEFFSAVQRRLGQTLERLRICFCNIKWNRPSQTSAAIAKRLLKCEKLVSLELNYLKFGAKQPVELSAGQRQTHHQGAEHEQANHWLLDAVIAGCPNLEELSLVGTSLNFEQAINFANQIRDHWKGTTLSIHTWRMGQDEQETDAIVSVIQQIFKDHKKFSTEYAGGYRGTLVIRRRKHLCGIVSRIRLMKMGIPNTGQRSGQFNRETFLVKLYHDEGNQRESEQSNPYAEELCPILPPGQRSLFGLTPFDYSIMLVHSWNLNKW